MPKEWIIEFENADEAVAFAKDIQVKNYAWKEIYEENEDNEAWICVLAVCDICKRQSVFFAPAEIYEDGISGVECSGCRNMSVYPKEGSFEDE